MKRAWWKANVQERDDLVGLDADILMHPRVWEASGHLEGLQILWFDCETANNGFEQTISTRCPECGGELTEARNFNLMFKTYLGPVEESAAIVYLRGDRQGIFVNFQNVCHHEKEDTFGVAQIGKSFRNEITPKLHLSDREFEQMEIGICRRGRMKSSTNNGLKTGLNGTLTWESPGTSTLTAS